MLSVSGIVNERNQEISELMKLHIQGVWQNAHEIYYATGSLYIQFNFNYAIWWQNQMGVNNFPKSLHCLASKPVTPAHKSINLPSQ